MPIVYLTDDDGSVIKCMEVDGFTIPIFNGIPNHETDYRSIPGWQARDDDVMICAYPKSGKYIRLLRFQLQSSKGFYKSSFGYTCFTLFPNF